MIIVSTERIARANRIPPRSLCARPQPSPPSPVRRLATGTTTLSSATSQGSATTMWGRPWTGMTRTTSNPGLSVSTRKASIRCREFEPRLPLQIPDSYLSTAPYWNNAGSSMSEQSALQRLTEHSRMVALTLPRHRERDSGSGAPPGPPSYFAYRFLRRSKASGPPSSICTCSVTVGSSSPP